MWDEEPVEARVSPTAQRYFAIEQEILWGRAHGRPTEDAEDRLLEESDALWLRMTEGERAAADARGRAYTAIETVAELPVRDTPVRLGGSEAPRRAA
jgi:hypothetical protein